MIRMTKLADYGIVLLSHMAGETPSLFAAPDLANATQLPLPMVSKILKQLAKNGLLLSHRGAKGGYSLAQAPASISVAAMIEALDGPIAVTDCSDDEPGLCSQEASCRIRENWQSINRAVKTALETVTLADLARNRTPPLVQLGGRLARTLPEGSSTFLESR
jgi:FeS assembly SUF system regulator